MRTLSLNLFGVKLLSVIFTLVLVAGCSSTSTTGDGSSTAGDASTSGAESGSVNGGDMGGSDMAASMGNVIYFDFDRDTIRSDAREVLMAHAARLKKGGSAALEGHADERGTREYNMALGERRAKAVRDFLVIQGVDRSQLEVVSYGEERPAVARSNEASWAKNRRVEIR